MSAGSRWRVFRARADETLPARLALRWMLALLRRPEQLHPWIRPNVRDRSNCNAAACPRHVCFAPDNGHSDPPTNEPRFAPFNLGEDRALPHHCSDWLDDCPGKLKLGILNPPVLSENHIW